MDISLLTLDGDPANVVLYGNSDGTYVTWVLSE